MNPMNALTEGTRQFLEAALDEGFELPLYLAVVSANGSLIFARYSSSDTRSEGYEPQILAQHNDQLGFNCPINAMLTDAKRQAARMLIEGPGEPEYFWPRSLPESSSGH